MSGVWGRLNKSVYPSHSFAPSPVTRSPSRSLARHLARPLARSPARTLARSLARSLDRSLDRSLARSLARSLLPLYTSEKVGKVGNVGNVGKVSVRGRLKKSGVRCPGTVGQICLPLSLVPPSLDPSSPRSAPRSRSYHFFNSGETLMRITKLNRDLKFPLIYRHSI